MGRAPRIEYEGALYHVMSRGNRQADIFHSCKDFDLFLNTLEEACGRTGWKIHAYVLMRNHYHLLLETPEANLVDGMRWLQGTYTKRFNIRHKLGGHLLQGRYKALVIDPQEDYFRTVGTYIHLNPARAHCVDTKHESLSSYKWSSYCQYLSPTSRPFWLETKRLLGSHGFSDNTDGLQQFEEYMQFRALQVCLPGNSHEFDEEWNPIRRGWAYGNDAFKKTLHGYIQASIAGHSRTSYSGKAIKTHDEQEAVRLLMKDLAILGLSDSDLPGLRKNDVRKKVIAWHIRTNTSVRNHWISEHLNMGHSSNLSRFYQEVSSAREGLLLELKNRVTKK